ETNQPGNGLKIYLSLNLPTMSGLSASQTTFSVTLFGMRNSDMENLTRLFSQMTAQFETAKMEISKSSLKTAVYLQVSQPKQGVISFRELLLTWYGLTKNANRT